MIQQVMNSQGSFKIPPVEHAVTAVFLGGRGFDYFARNVFCQNARKCILPENFCMPRNILANSVRAFWRYFPVQNHISLTN